MIPANMIIKKNKSFQRKVSNLLKYSNSIPFKSSKIRENGVITSYISLIKRVNLVKAAQNEEDCWLFCRNPIC